MSRRAKRTPRSPFVVTAAAMAVLGACGGSVEPPEKHVSINPPPPDDGGRLPEARPEAGPDAQPGTCPATTPTPNAACAVDSNKSCDYPAQCGGGSFARCVNGRWQVAVGNPPPVACPKTMPTEGQSCECAGVVSCSYYRDCYGTTEEDVSECINGRWRNRVWSCNPPPIWDGGTPVLIEAGGRDE